MALYSCVILAAVMLCVGYSQSCISSVVPGNVSALSAEPDILSVVISWEPPTVGLGYISTYKLCSKPVLARFQNCLIFEEASVQSFRIEHLLPQTVYIVTLSASIADSEGPVEQVVVRTNSVGECRHVHACVVFRSIFVY